MNRPILVIAAVFALCGLPATALAMNCGIDFQHAYETGVRDGRVDGSHEAENDPTRHRPHLFRNIDDGKGRAKCYLEGYNTGYDNAYADATRADASKPSWDEAPEYGTNEREYYDDGCREGTGDAEMNMSMAYQRHSDMYDSRFEPYFRDGYETCWRHYR